MQFWYQSKLSLPAVLLLPFAKLALWLTRQRRARRNQRPYPVPVVVVGNITVGGTGKTPMIILLVQRLQAQGHRVGVVSRGYAAKPDQAFPILLNEAHTAAQVGDEPKLIFKSTGATVVIDPDRDRAVRHLLRQSEVDVVISDDGLQHYRMARDIEIVMIDGLRGLGNGQLLPAGPLREAPDRLATVDFIFAKQSSEHTAQWPEAIAVKLSASSPVNAFGQLLTPCPVSVCSGIGNFESFLATVRALGFQIEASQRFGDHQVIPDSTLSNAERPILVTEKDFIKISHPAAHIYYVPVSLEIPASAEAAVMTKVMEKIDEKSRHHSR